MLNVETGYILLPRPFARNARSRVCGEQDGLTKLPTNSGDNLPGKSKAAAKPFFHRLRPPDKHHRSGRSNQWRRNPTGLKDTGDFSPAAPSCALLFPSCGLRVVVEALPKSPRPVPVRQFAPSWAVCKNPPFSPTAAPSR